MNTKRIKRGFTLIELLVVTFIIALLLSLMMPALSTAREQAKTTVCAANLYSMGLALQIYEDSNNQKLPPHYVPSLGEVYDRQGAMPWYSYIAYEGNPPNKKAYQLGKLHREALIDNSRIFYCPSRGFKDTFRDSGKKYYTHDYYVVNNVWALNYPDGKVRLNYNYWLHGRKTFNELQDKPVVFDIIHHWYTISHVRHNTPRGINALFGDGHVTFTIKEDIFDYGLWNGGPNCTQFGGPGHHLDLFEEIIRLLEP